MAAAAAAMTAAVARRLRAMGREGRSAEKGKRELGKQSGGGRRYERVQPRPGARGAAERTPAACATGRVVSTLRFGVAAAAVPVERINADGDRAKTCTIWIQKSNNPCYFFIACRYSPENYHTQSRNR